MKIFAAVIPLALIAIFCVEFAQLQPIEVTNDNFNKVLSEGPIFIKFYAPWCGFCKKLAPTWEELSADERLTSAGIRIAKLDCTEHQNLCHQYGVTGFPTLKLFKNGKPFTYEGDRSMASLVDFALHPKEAESDQKKPIKWSEQSGIVDIDHTNFAQLHTGKWLLAFYADWCGSCKKMAPVYESVAEKLKGKVNLAKSNIDGNGSGLSRFFNVTQVPTIYFFTDGIMYPMEYLSQSAEGFIQFVEEGYKSQAQDQIPKIDLSQPPKPRAPPAAQKKDTNPVMEFLSQWKFDQQEALMGAAASFLLFIFGFTLGRVTASPAQPQVVKSKKTN